MLTERATKCPVMGPALNIRSQEIVATYASVAGHDDVDKIHKAKGVVPSPDATAEKCPHASMALMAAKRAEEISAATAAVAHNQLGLENTAEQAAAMGCPFHKAASENAASKSTSAIDAHKPAATPAKESTDEFNYEHFYATELEKKRRDDSYRYFNNINRLAARFPVAHTAKVSDEVEVWCANDYLGMGNNPVVLETIQYVFFLGLCCA